MKNALICLFLISIIGCKSNEYTLIENESYRVYRPPGTIKIKENLYADVTELTNIDYKEFMVWTETIFGKDSKEYQELLLDETVWNNQNNANGLKEEYDQHPKYYSYPLVGITLEQAKKYTKWRTDRVAEMLLIQKKLIKPASFIMDKK